jgi:hypothetical protein
MNLRKSLDWSPSGALAAPAGLRGRYWTAPAYHAAEAVRQTCRRVYAAWDPVAALRGLGLVGALGMSLWCEWQAIAWLARWIY